MRYDVTPRGPLQGDITVPGDCRLTLSAMAYSVLCPAPVTIVNPSPDPDVPLFRDYLETNGAATFSDTENGFVITGKGWNQGIIINGHVPRAIVHIVASSAVYSGRDVTFLPEHEAETAVMNRTAGYLASLGSGTPERRLTDGAVTMSGAAFPSGNRFEAASSWAFEMITAGAMAVGSAVSISCQTPVVSHSTALMAMLGFIADSDASDAKELEIARRLARMSGELAPDIRRFVLKPCDPPIVAIPGDTLIAAACAAAAAIVPKSKVTVRNVLYEPGRRGFFDCLRRMKGDVSNTPSKRRHSFDTADIAISWSALEGVHVTGTQAQTLVQELPVLGMLAAFAKGESVISDVAEGSSSGGDTFVALADGLEMLGAHVGDFADGIVVSGGKELRGNLVDSFGDPAVALALSVAGLNAAGSTAVFGCDSRTWPVSAFDSILGTLITRIL